MERAGGAAAQEERRRRLQEYLAAKGKLKGPSAKPYLKDRTNHPNPLPKPLAKPEHVARSRENVVTSTAKGTRRDNKLGVPSTHRAGLGPPQRPSKPPHGVAAAAAPSEQLRKSTRPPSMKPSVQPRGKLPPSTSTRLDARRAEEAAKEPVPAATLPGAPRSLNRRLHERLLCNKENFPGQGPSERAPSSVFEPNGKSDRRASKTLALERDFKTRRERLQEPVLPPASTQARRIPKTPTPEDRKRQLQEWLASKGKSYKRPPMTLPRKKPPKEKPVCRSSAKEEKEERPERVCLDRINSILTNCLKLVEEGVPTEKLLDMLAHVPHTERYARFWVCKAKLLARAGPFDAMGLYKDAVCAGAVPLQELREVILQMLKGAGGTCEGPACPPGQAPGLACPSSPGALDGARSPHPANEAALLFSSQPEPPALWEATTPGPSERLRTAETPCVTGKRPPSSSIKLKLRVLSVPRPKECPAEGQELRLLTPVRRSQRIERAGSRYPPMLKDHDTVVSSLNDILDAEEEGELFFRKNEALPEVTEMEILAL
ncbi:cytoskeleton-associated protein 2-like [Eudromia elegans]